MWASIANSILKHIEITKYYQTHAKRLICHSILATISRNRQNHIKLQNATIFKCCQRPRLQDSNRNRTTTQTNPKKRPPTWNPHKNSSFENQLKVVGFGNRLKVVAKNQAKQKLKQDSIKNPDRRKVEGEVPHFHGAMAFRRRALMYVYVRIYRS